MGDAGPVEISQALEPGDLHDIQRFKYDVYVAEMGRYGSIADHDNRLLIEPDDATSHIFQARAAGRLVGTMRLTWGGTEGALTQRHIEQYDLEGFLGAVGPACIVIGERFMIDPALRGSDVLFAMFCTYMGFVNQRRIQLVFGDCEPHLLNTYLSLGFRTYTRNNVNSPETGYLVPLVIVAEDCDHMKKIGSPLASVLTDFGGDCRVPANIADLLAGGEAVMSQKMLTKETFWSKLQAAVPKAGLSDVDLFTGMSKEEIEICLDKSVSIECKPGDRVIKKGNVAKNMSMVLSGTLEVRDGEEVVALLSAGEMFGEIAFFLKLPRTMDVVAATDDVKIVSFSESTIRKMLEAHPDVATKLLFNISRILCTRLINANKHAVEDEGA